MSQRMQSRAMLIRALALGFAGICGAQGTDADRIKTVVAEPPSFRVAVLYGGESTGDGHLVHKNDHDYTLNRLGWTYKKYARTEISKLAEELDQYDLLLGCPLSSTQETYEPFGGKWRAFVDAGGCIALTDCCYPESVTWLRSLGEGFGEVCAWGDCANDRNRGPACPVTPTHPIHLLPNAVEQQWQSWGHIKVSDAEGWERAVNCGCNKKLGITAVRRTGKGLVYLTSRRPDDAWPNEFENIRANLELQRVGLTATAFEMTPLTAGPGQVRLSLKSVAAVHASLVLTVTPENDARKPMQVTLRKTLTPSGVTEFVMPYRLSLRGPVRAVLCVVTPAGVSVISDLKIVIPELLTLTPPSYRGLVPHVRRNKNTTVGVKISPDGEGTALMRLQIQVTGTTGMPVVRVPDQKIVQLAFRQPIVLPDNLPEGDYTVKAVLLVGGVSKGKAETAFTILENKPGTAVIGEDNVLITDDRPFFPLGVYHIGAEDFSYAAELGLNTIQIMDYTHDSGVGGDLDKAHALGLKGVVEIGNVFKYPMRIALVEPIKTHPALLAWYGYDEPRPGNLESAMSFTEKLGQRDRFHPVFSVTFIEELYPSHAQLFDIFGIDPYCFPKVSGVGTLSQAALRATRRERPLWTVLPAFGNETPDGLRCMAYLAVVNEAQGIFWYAWNDDGVSKGLKFHPELHPAIKRTCTELEQLIPAILGKNRQYFRLQDDKVQGLICGDVGQNRCLILANAGEQALDEVVIDIPNVRLNSAGLKSLFGTPPLQINYIKTVGTFTPYEVKVFTW